MQSYIVKMRRELHENAEVGFDLDKTLAIIKRELDNMGVPYTEKFGRSSIVATLEGEDSSRTVGIRADIDALPITETNDIPYKSHTEGTMHACGHDAHAAMALDALRRLTALDKLPFRVKVIFQAAEEYNISGAKLMADDGVMDGIDEIVAIHVDPTVASGCVAVSEGRQNAVSFGFKLKFLGKSTHVATQHLGIDAIMMAVNTITAVQNMISKELPAAEQAIFNAGSIHGGVTNNVICDKCELFCTLRVTSDAMAELVEGKIRRILAAIELSSGGKAEFIPIKYYPVVINDKSTVEKARRALSGFLPKGKILSREPDMIGEDFAYLARLKPACMIRLGVRNAALGIQSSLHSSSFNIDETALDIGSEFFYRFAMGEK